MAEVQKINAVVTELKKRALKYGTGAPVVVVGFATAYALPLHENIEMKWRGLPRKAPAKGVYWGPAGEAKFLEKPARRLSRDGTIGRIIAAALQTGEKLPQALLLAGMRLQRDSLMLVPIDTGVLKNSSFTELESPGT